MAKLADGYLEGFQQYEVEPNDEVEECDECGGDLANGETYWTREDEILCEACFSEWKEENA